MLVSTGYRHYIKGEVSIEKASGFAAKMAQLYPIHATADMRSWAKKTGRYSSMLIMYPKDKDLSKVLYWLLATSGGAPKDYVDIHAREKLSEALLVPLSWGHQYECVRLEKTVASGKRVSWTWRMKTDYYARLKASAKEAADSGATATVNLLKMLSRMPLFSGVRQQLIELDEFTRAVWRKQKKAPYPDPLRPAGSDPDVPLTKCLPVMSKISVWGDLTLPVLIATMQKEREERLKNAEAQAIAVVEVL